MKTEFRTKRQLRIEIIKSAAVLLLAIILLVSVVLAWFKGAIEPSIEPFEIKIINLNNDNELGSEIVTDKHVVLPCATILGDPTISADDFSKTLKVMPLKVESVLTNDIDITIEPVPGLHFYIDVNYDSEEDNALTYAQTITDNFNNGSGNDLSKKMAYDLTPVVDENGESRPKDLDVDGKYRHWVAIIYWADYDYVTKSGDTIGQVINRDGKIELNSTMSFKVSREES